MGKHVHTFESHHQSKITNMKRYYEQRDASCDSFSASCRTISVDQRQEAETTSIEEDEYNNNHYYYHKEQKNQDNKQQQNQIFLHHPHNDEMRDDYIDDSNTLETSSFCKESNDYNK